MGVDSPWPVRSPFYLRINGGAWFHVEGIRPEVDVEVDRPRSSFTTLGGNRYEQFAPLGARSWDVEMEREGLATLAALAYAVDASDVYLWDTTAAVANMLARREAEGVSGAATLTVDSIPMPALAAGAVATSLVRSGQSYILSGYTTAAATTVIGTYNVGAGAVNVVAPAGSGARYWSVTIGPVGADGTFTYTQTTDDDTTALRLTEGATRVDSKTWHPGQRVPCQVVVDDPQRVLQRVLDGSKPELDASVQLREVG